MDLLTAIGSAMSNIASIEVFLWMLLGVALGSILGLFPGMGGLTGIALLLPLTFGMDPVAGISLLIGFTAVGNTSETFPAVLLGVPGGGGGSQATVLDGYALAQKGHARRALGASFASSMFGGLIGALALLVVVLIAGPLVQALGSPELLMLSVLGIATVAMLVRGDVILGLVAALIGVMLSMVGAAPSSGEQRYVFGQLYLYEGLPLTVIALGFFAFPEIMSMLVTKQSIAKSPELKGTMREGFLAAWKHRLLLARSSLIGVGMGAVPGVSGPVIDWIAYGAAKATVRDSSKFGQGDIRGLIAPEAANNSKDGGSLMPTLILGIPGSGSMALLLGGLMLMGVQAGPSMVSANLDLTLTIIWTLAIANVLACLACIGFTGYIAKISLIPGSVLAPFLLILFFAAAYQASHSVWDLLFFVGIGVLSYAMKLASWPRAPVIIGFVLGLSIERYLHLSNSRFGDEWLTRPSVLAIGGVTVLILFGAPLIQAAKRKLARKANTIPETAGGTDDK